MLRRFTQGLGRKHIRYVRRVLLRVLAYERSARIHNRCTKHTRKHPPNTIIGAHSLNLIIQYYDLKSNR